MNASYVRDYLQELAESGGHRHHDEVCDAIGFPEDDGQRRNLKNYLTQGDLVKDSRHGLRISPDGVEHLHRLRQEKREEELLEKEQDRLDTQERIKEAQEDFWENAKTNNTRMAFFTGLLVLLTLVNGALSFHTNAPRMLVYANIETECPDAITDDPQPDLILKIRNTGDMAGHIRWLVGTKNITKSQLDSPDDSREISLPPGGEETIAYDLQVQDPDDGQARLVLNSRRDSTWNPWGDDERRIVCHYTIGDRFYHLQDIEKTELDILIPETFLKDA